VSLAANLSRGVEVEPTRSALAFIETLWSSAAFVSPDDATAAAAVGLSLPGAYVRVLGANLAAAAAECATPQLLEPMGHALWAMVNTCHEEGGDALLGWLSGVLAHAVTAGDGLEIPITGVRAGAVTEDDVAAFARAVARRPPHPALRLAELVAVFGRACRGQGPATSIADFM